MSSPDESPASAPPNLLNPLRKSLSGQDLTAKANQDSLGETQEVAAQEPVANESEVEEKKKEGVVTPLTDGSGEETTANATATDVTPNDEGQVSDAAETLLTEPHGEKKHRVTGFKRLKSGLTKFSKGGNRSAGDSQTDHAVQASADTSAKVSIADARVQEGEGGDAAGEGADGEFSADAAAVAVNGDETVVDATLLAGGAQGDDVDKIPDDPVALADIIRNLVRSLPQPTDPVPVPSKPKLPQLDGSGKPITPSDAVLTDNNQLITKLRSPAVMNGKAGDAPEGEEAPTVFAILDSFKAPSSAPGNTESGGKGSNDTDGDDGAGEDDGGSDEEIEPHTIADDWSLMVYLPLNPTKKSKVEMAKFELVPINPEFKQMIKANTGANDSKVVELLSTYRPFGTFGRGTVFPVINEDGTSGGKIKEAAFRWPKPSWKLWPWKKKTPTPAPAPAPSQPPTSAPDTDSKAPESGSGDADKKPEQDDKATEGDKDKKLPNKLRKPNPTLNQRVWIPSKEHVSVQVLWWGYRIFLPPPVMVILSDKSLEATKRATLIVNALTWLFTQMPLTMFPAPMQPAVLLLQQIIPFIGYIGTFVTWSWSMIKSYDVGYGVILSATWILPVALIPGTWQPYDFPETNPPDTGTTPSQPSTGTPTQLPAGNGQPPATQPLTVGTLTPMAGISLTTSTRLKMVKGNSVPSEPTVSVDVEPELTRSTRLKLVKGNIAAESNVNELPPTVSKRLALVKGHVVPVLSTDPEEDVVGSELPKTMSKRLALVKGKGEDVATGEKERATGGVWKYFKGGSKDVKHST